MKALHPSDIGLILSYQCQAACAHCLYNCGPDWQDWMSGESIEAALEAMLLWEGPFQVHITGGEPFLNFPRLLHAVETATQLGIPRYVETNAGWCVREALVQERFTRLRQAGLQAILISCSPFHAAKIPAERTMLAIRKAREVFGPEHVMVYLPEWVQQLQQFGGQGTIPLKTYAELIGPTQAGQLLWEGYGLISGGRSGYRLGHLIERKPAAAFAGRNCRAEILFAHHSHFDLYGHFISGFCGGLRVGDWHELAEVLHAYQAAEYPHILRQLIEAGPYQLAQWAQEHYDYQTGSDGFAGKCHLCVDVRKHLTDYECFDELQPLEFYQHF